MAYSPISFIASNYRDYKNNWLKAYEPGTTTPKVMATDSTLSTLISKAELNIDGFIVSAGQALIIPYIDGFYDLWLFPTEPEADANDTSNALRVADNLIGVNGAGLSESNVKSFATLQDAIDEPSAFKIYEGAALSIGEREAGKGGGSTWDVVLASSVSPNTYDIVQCVGFPDLALVIRRGEVITAAQIGLFGDGSDEYAALKVLLSYGGSVDLQNLSIKTESSVSIGGESITLMNAGTLTYMGGTQQQYCLSLTFNDVIDSDGFTIDGGGLCDKVFQCISDNDALGTCILNKTKVTGARITASSGALAGGIYIAGDYDTIILNEPEADNIDHSEDLNQSARGIVTLPGAGQGARRTVINTPKISLITPAKDGDGIFLQSNRVGAECTINNLYSLNCAKRAIKTQIYKTIVNSPVIERNISYEAISGGQTEIDAQFGNIIVNSPTFLYASSDTYPSGGLMTFSPERNAGSNGAPATLNGGVCNFIDQANRTVAKIFECVSFVEDDVLRGAMCKGFTFNGKIDTYAPFRIRPKASTTFNKVLTDGFLVEGFYIEEILTATPSIFSTDRSGTGYAYAKGLSIIDCVVSDQSTDVAQVYEVTSNVGATVDLSVENYRVTNTPSANTGDRPYVETTSQDDVFSKIITMPLNSGLRFTFMYSCSNDPSTSSAYIDGIIQMDDGGDPAVIYELHENKTNALSGNLSITAILNSGRFDIAFNKAAGSGTASGRATILLEGGGYVQGQ